MDDQVALKYEDHGRGVMTVLLYQLLYCSIVMTVLLGNDGLG